MFSYCRVRSHIECETRLRCWRHACVQRVGVFEMVIPKGDILLGDGEGEESALQRLGLVVILQFHMHLRAIFAQAVTFIVSACHCLDNSSVGADTENAVHCRPIICSQLSKTHTYTHLSRVGKAS